jgi:hypothetical protein
MTVLIITVCHSLNQSSLESWLPMTVFTPLIHSFHQVYHTVKSLSRPTNLLTSNNLDRTREYSCFQGPRFVEYSKDSLKPTSTNFKQKSARATFAHSTRCNSIRQSSTSPFPQIFERIHKPSSNPRIGAADLSSTQKYFPLRVWRWHLRFLEVRVYQALTLIPTLLLCLDLDQSLVKIG